MKLFWLLDKKYFVITLFLYLILVFIWINIFPSDYDWNIIMFLTLWLWDVVNLDNNLWHISLAGWLAFLMFYILLRKGLFSKGNFKFLIIYLLWFIWIWFDLAGSYLISYTWWTFLLIITSIWYLFFNPLFPLVLIISFIWKKEGTLNTTLKNNTNQDMDLKINKHNQRKRNFFEAVFYNKLLWPKVPLEMKDNLLSSPKWRLIVVCYPISFLLAVAFVFLVCLLLFRNDDEIFIFGTSTSIVLFFLYGWLVWKTKLTIDYIKWGE